MTIEVLTRMRLPIAPVLPDEVARLVDIPGGIVPSVGRIEVRNNSVIVRFDRPCPKGCYLQFWRYRRSKQGAGATRGDHEAYNFRPVQMLGNVAPTAYLSSTNTAGFPRIQIPLGATSIFAGTIVQCFRPPVVRRSYGYNLNADGMESYSRYIRDGRNGWPVPGNPGYYTTQQGVSEKKRAMKCVLKFGVYQHYRETPTDHAIINQGPLSPETLIIQRWRFAGASSVDFRWGLKVDVM